MPLPSRLERHTVVPADTVRPRGGVMAVFSGQKRTGPWELPRHMRVAAVMGSVELDLREAVMAEGEIEIEIFCLFGSVEICVPPGVQVECDGDAFAGEFGYSPDSMFMPQLGAPRVRITGSATFGEVKCETRLPGETASEAKRRRKQPDKWLGAGY